MKIFVRVLLLAALIVLGVWLWTILFPSPEKQVRKRIAEVARRASFPSAENIVKTGLRIQGLVKCFAPKVEIAINLPGNQRHEIAGRDEISSSAGIARQSLRWLKVELLDPSITIASDKETAVVNLTAKVTFPDQRDFFVQEMKVTLKKIDGEWLIILIETVKTLSRGPMRGLPGFSTARWKGEPTPYPCPRGSAGLLPSLEGLGVGRLNESWFNSAPA